MKDQPRDDIPLGYTYDARGNVMGYVTTETPWVEGQQYEVEI
ncbi:MAG: hypothetical protein RLZZ292_1939 [Bacteroidota bacterium]|jgi:hypothetical protein